MPPYGGIPFGDFPAGLGHDLRHPEQSPARALDMYGLAHSCPRLCCPEASVETLGGPAFEPLDHNGLGAQFLSPKGIG